MDRDRAGPLPILTFHALAPVDSPIAFDPTRFRRLVEALADAGFRAVDLEVWIAGGRPAVERSYAIAFDDGLRSIRLAAEVLAPLGAGATAFLVTGRMGSDNAWPGQAAGVPRGRLLGWSELADLESAGVRFAAHSRTHPRLDRADDRELEDELRGSRQDLEDRLGRPCRLFAYPYGLAPSRVREAAARHFDAAFGTRLDYAGPAEDPFLISRIDAHYLRSRRSIQDLLSGRLRGRLRVRRALREIRQAGVAFLENTGRPVAPEIGMDRPERSIPNAPHLRPGPAIPDAREAAER